MIFVISIISILHCVICSCIPIICYEAINHFVISPTLVTPPLVYAHHVDQEKGLSICMTDSIIGENDWYYTYIQASYLGDYNDDRVFHAPEHFYYQIRKEGSSEWTEYDSEFYLNEYGEYEIIAYSSYKDNISHQVTTSVVYSPSGFTSQCGDFIVHNGSVYYINDEDSTLRMADCYFNTSFLMNFPIIHPEPWVTNHIPSIIHSQGHDYTVKEIGVGALHDCIYVSIPSTVLYIDTQYPYWNNSLNCMAQVSVDPENPVYDSRGNCNAVIETASNKLIMGSLNTVIPDDVTVIGEFAFNITSLAEITIPASVTTISTSAFIGTALTDVTIGSSVETIGAWCFYYCNNLQNVTIGASVDSIGRDAFWGCEKLRKVVCQAINTPIASEAFDPMAYSEVILFVPNESLEDYRAHQTWGRFTHIVPFIGAGPGDANGDGAVSVKDVTDLIDLMLRGEEIPAYCDVNGDGNVSIKDITDLIDMLLSGN